MNQAQEQQQQSSQWIEKLALEELNMEETGIVNFNEHLDPKVFLDESSIEFMDKLKNRFQVYIQKFNFYRGEKTPGAGIKIFKISNTVNDFMLFRNSLRLVIGRKSSDLISIGFLSNSSGPFGARLQNAPNVSKSSHNIKAHVGPFNDITWRFQGEVVDVDSIVKHYLTEFIKLSSR